MAVGNTRYFRFAIIAVTVILLAVLGWKLMPPLLKRKFPLKDGTALQVERVTYGKRVPFKPGGWFEPIKEKAAKVLPSKLVAKYFPSLPPTRTSWTLITPDHTNLDALHLWVAHRNATNGFEPVSILSAELVDDHGFVYRSTKSGGEDFGATPRATSYAGGLGPQADLLWLVFEAFPRHEQRLHLRLYSQRGGEEVASFEIANPAPAALQKKWTTEPLPITRPDRDISFTLASLAIKTNYVQGDTNRLPYMRRPFDNALELAPLFEVSERGKTSAAWEAVSYELSDSSGNLASRSYYNPKSVFLSPREPAWKLSVTFCGSDHSLSASNFTWSLPPVAVPLPGKFVSLDTNFDLHGISVSVAAVGGPGKVTYAQDNRWSRSSSSQIRTSSFTPISSAVLESDTNTSWSSSGGNNYDFHSPKPHLAVNFDGVAEDQWLSVRVVDDQGRETFAVDNETTQRMTPGAASSHYLSKIYGLQLRFLTFDLAPDAKTITFTFSLHTARTVEFIFKPPQP